MFNFFTSFAANTHFEKHRLELTTKTLDAPNEHSLKCTPLPSDRPHQHLQQQRRRNQGTDRLRNHHQETTHLRLQE